jgi:PKD repeat protein
MSDRLMHRLQVRDFGTYKTMVTAHTVDVGGGRAGLRWYELRNPGGGWSLYQEGTFGPADGEHRWMPSAAMNAAGDIGIGYLLASDNTYVSTAVAGQSAAQSGSGFLDSGEDVCSAGTGVQQGTARAGDYSATSVDPSGDSFWHTNEVFVDTGQFQWSTFVCNFTVGEGVGGGGNKAPTANFTYVCTGLECNFTDASTDGDGTVVGWDWNFGDDATSTAQNPTHEYAAEGMYTVTLTATDDDGATGGDSQNVSVSVPPAGDFALTATGYKYRGLQKADLAWSGASSGNVDIYRDGTMITTTDNDGAHTDDIDARGGGSYTYQVCEAGGTSTCSNPADVSF